MIYTCLTVKFFYSLIQEYSLALWQCYDRYLLHFGNINVEEITDVDSFRLTFFPEGFDSENAGLTVSLKNITVKLWKCMHYFYYRYYRLFCYGHYYI